MRPSERVGEGILKLWNEENGLSAFEIWPKRFFLSSFSTHSPRFPQFSHAALLTIYFAFRTSMAESEVEGSDFL